MFKGWFRKKQSLNHAHALYGAVVARARDAEFFRLFGVPDTFDGRFEMLVMHLYLLLSRLKEEDENTRNISQLVFDAFIDDMDGALRELGVGDQVVPKRIAKMTRVFYGRTGAYEGVLSQNQREIELAQIVERNLFPDDDANGRDQALARYMIDQYDYLAATPAANIIKSHNIFAEFDKLERDCESLSGN